ncbi:M48 family metalloprotease [Halobacteriovorax sp.]|uniref:M48 family metalloprotease n=1 Tax=Halobacteriovorax sp. TaxID=2020862 RepID=UPI0035645444
MSKELIKHLKKDLIQINSTDHGRRAFLISLPILLASCASAPKHRMREGDNTGQETSLSFSDERAMTNEYLPQMEKEYPTLSSNYAQSYIKDLGKKIVSANGLEGHPYNYNFRVVESKMVNAFALPAGEVFITAPLIKMASSEAELAGVIGHEVGHIKARHTAERIEAQKESKTRNMLFGLGGAILGGAAGYGLGKALCKKNDRECIKRIALYGGAAGAGGVLLIQKFGFMANSREDEMEADRIGFNTSLTAGYDPRHIGKFYEKLLTMERQYQGNSNQFSKAFADALSTHPPSEQRVRQMNEMSREVSSRKGIITTNSFEKVKSLI